MAERPREVLSELATGNTRFKALWQQFLDRRAHVAVTHGQPLRSGPKGGFDRAIIAAISRRPLDPTVAAMVDSGRPVEIDIRTYIGPEGDPSLVSGVGPSELSDELKEEIRDLMMRSSRRAQGAPIYIPRLMRIPDYAFSPLPGTDEAEDLNPDAFMQLASRVGVSRALGVLPILPNLSDSVPAPLPQVPEQYNAMPIGQVILRWQRHDSSATAVFVRRFRIFGEDHGRWRHELQSYHEILQTRQQVLTLADSLAGSTARSRAVEIPPLPDSPGYRRPPGQRAVYDTLLA